VNPADLVAIDAILARAKSRGYVPHKPHPKQAEFLALTSREALYGGAAGGGKSDALLMAALQYVHVPGYNALILRRTFADLSLPDAIMARAKEWLAGTDAVWNAQEKKFTFPSGAVLQFGFLDSDKDRFRYQGGAYHFIAFDELTQFPEAWYRYLFSRLRRAKGSPVPPRVRAATNPGGIGHEWVRRRFVATPDPKRPFVSARLDDNPSLDAVEYREALAELDTTTRRQLEEGVWIRDAEGLVYRYSETRNVIAKAPECQRYLLGIDYGSRSPTAFVLVGWRLGDPTVYVLKAWKKREMIPSAAAEAVKKFQQDYPIQRIVGDPGGPGSGFIGEAQQRFGIPIEAAEKTNKLGYVKLLNGDLERGRVKIVLSECEPLATEWLELPWHEDQDREAPGFDNHCADALLYAWRAAYAWTQKDTEMGEPTTTPDAVNKAEARRKAEYLVNRQKQADRARRQGQLPVTHRLRQH
jgi:hypothetical protein